MTKTRSARVVGLLSVLLALSLVLAPPAQALIPVEDIIQAVEQVIHEIELWTTRILTYHQYRMMIKEGEWYAALYAYLYTVDEFFPDADMGDFDEGVRDVRDLYQGLSGQYGRAKTSMNKVFGIMNEGGSETYDLEQSPREVMLELMDAVAARTSKEVGKFRLGKDARKAKTEEILAKAEGYTGSDQQLQLVNSTLANLYEATNDQTMKIVTQTEILATMLEVEREERQRQEVTNEVAGTGFNLFVQELDLGRPQIELP